MSTQTAQAGGQMVGRVPTWDRPDRLRKARVSAGLSVEQLSTLAGISKKTINNYENGAVVPRRSSIIAWAFATGVDLTWLEIGQTRPDVPDGGGWAPRGSNPEPTVHVSGQGRVLRLFQTPETYDSVSAQVGA